MTLDLPIKDTFTSTAARELPRWTRRLRLTAKPWPPATKPDATARGPIGSAVPGSRCAQQRRSNYPVRSHTNHYAPALLLWCNGRSRMVAWWVP
jgi:hypothetical protein